MSWRISGSNFESCNGDAICPSRRINGVPGGRSTLGICLGVLPWLIQESAAHGTDVAEEFVADELVVDDGRWRSATAACAAMA